MVMVSEVVTAPPHVQTCLQQGVERACASGRPVVVSIGATLPWIDPLAAFAAAAGEERSYWERPSRHSALAGIGVAHRIEADPARAGAAWRLLVANAVVDAASGGPLLMGGFAFDPQATASPLWRGFPAGRLVLPRLTVAADGATTTVTLNAVVTPGADIAAEAQRLGDTWTAVFRRLDTTSLDRAHGQELLERRDVPERQEWEALVGAAAQTCANGYVEKVVLARALEVSARWPFDPAVALERLRRAYPSAYIFATDIGGRCFLGATPERLVRLRGGVVDVACLAGSAPRGATSEEDSYLGGALLSSAKDHAEHAIVVREVRSRLAGLTSGLRVPVAPRLLRLQNVQHLYTPVEAQVLPGTCVIDLVQGLHPTPAVGGYPRDAALGYIRAHEGLDRGWYAGPIGVVDRHGEGEFAVALRSALLDSAKATLFAGCGIVAASRPADEFAETCLKLRPMLTALSGVEPA